MTSLRWILVPVLFFSSYLPILADVGDPQVRTEHLWYPGELSCSTFERLLATQAADYRRVVGVDPKTDEEKALASWFWRNTHYFHNEDAFQDYFGKGFQKEESRPREYWTGLFACGFGLCGTTHAQWSAEMERVLGHARARVVGVDGHSSFEVFLTGGPYGKGKWVLLDHDIGTVIFNLQGNALLSIPEIKSDLRVTQRSFMPERQRGWLVSSLHVDDAPGVYTKFDSVAYLSGYDAAPPSVHLRRGETLRRYLQPGLEDGKTFVFWGRNYNRGGIPGPERDLTWVNQPEKMRGSTEGTPTRIGQARHGNAVYTYVPDFSNGDYREGIVSEDDRQVTFEFSTPYLIGATPSDSKPYTAYEPGCKNGLVLHGKASCGVELSLDRGRTWKDCGPFRDGLDLTDLVKGRQQYQIRFGAGAKQLTGSGLVLVTVCQASSSILPHLKEGGDTVHFEASGKEVITAGPSLQEAQTHVVEGAFGTPQVTLELKAPRNEPILAVHAAAVAASGNPPQPNVLYQIEFSTDDGKTYKPMIKDWTIPRRGVEPDDFRAESFSYGSAQFRDSKAASVRVRFQNTGNKPYLRAEMQLVCKARNQDATKVTFDWTDNAGKHRESHVFEPGRVGEWPVATGQGVVTRWVEFTPIQKSK